MKIFVALAVLSMIYNVNSTPVFSCLASNTISVTVDLESNPELKDAFVTVADAPECSRGGAVQLKKDTKDETKQIANLTCFKYTLGVGFEIQFVKNTMFANEKKFGYTCLASN